MGAQEQPSPFEHRNIGRDISIPGCGEKGGEREPALSILEDSGPGSNNGLETNTTDEELYEIFFCGNSIN